MIIIHFEEEVGSPLEIHPDLLQNLQHQLEQLDQLQGRLSYDQRQRTLTSQKGRRTSHIARSQSMSIVRNNTLTRSDSQAILIGNAVNEVMAPTPRHGPRAFPSSLILGKSVYQPMRNLFGVSKLQIQKMRKRSRQKKRLQGKSLPRSLDL